MTQEDRKLLLTDLCARLLYAVFMTNKKLHETFYPLTCEDLKDAMFDDDWDDIPYLRPMSSMTEEEREEYINIKKGECNGCVLTGKGDPNTEFLLVDFLNSHHFDYRGLIEKGLALKAPKDMYNIK